MRISSPCCRLKRRPLLFPASCTVLSAVLAVALAGCGPSFHSSGEGVTIELPAPTGFQVKGTTYSQIALGWTFDSGNAEGFWIERAPDNGGVPGAWALIADLSASIFLYTDPNLADGTVLWYRMRAYHSHGSSPYSDTISGCTILREPADLFAVRGPSPTEIDLSWTDRSDAEEGFTVERADDVNGSPSTWAPVAVLPGPDIESHRDTNLSPGSRYWYRVSAFNAAFGDSAPSNEDSAVAGWSAVRVAGGGSHSLALKANGAVWAWGGNFSGQLGNGSNQDSNVPVAVSNLADVQAIAAGWNHSLALGIDGTVRAWGANASGQLGNGTNTGSNVPVVVSNLSGVIAIAAGGEFSLALETDGTVRAWGANSSGQLGNGTNTGSNVPVAVSNLSGAAAVAAGFSHSLALDGNGGAWAWGYNGAGQLGNGTWTGSTVPVQVLNLTGAGSIAAGAYHSLAIAAGGDVLSWGSNLRGQLGDGTFVDSNIPVAVLELSEIDSLAAGGWHSLALADDGGAWAFGGNANGQLGDGTNANSNLAVPVFGLSGIDAVSAGFSHSLALDQGGDVWAWGYNGTGQLGDGSWLDSSVPVRVSDF